MKSNVIFIGMGRASQMLLMFLTYRVMSSLFSVESMGGYYFLLSVAGAYGLIIANPFGMYVNRKAHDWILEKKFLDHMKMTIKFYFVGCFAMIPFLYFYREKFQSFEQGESNFIVILSLMVLFIFTNTLQSTLIPIFNLIGEVKKFVILTFFTTVLGLILSVLLVQYYLRDPLIWIFGQAISYSIFSLIAFQLLSKKYHETEKSLQKNSVKSIFKFALPIALTNIFVWSMSQSFRFFLKDNVDPVSFGEMTFGLGLATSLSVAVEYLFQQLFFPNFYKNLGQDLGSKEDSWNKLLNSLIPSFIVYALFLACMSPYLIRVLADQKFAQASYYLSVGALVEFFRMSSNIFNLSTHADMKTEKALLPYLISGGVTLALIQIISISPQYFYMTPYVLGFGYFLATLFLGKSTASIFKINFEYKKSMLALLISIPFLIPNLFFSGYQSSITGSIVLCLIFGVYLLFVLYLQHKNELKI